MLRGLHFQGPPAAHVKLVSCLHGEVVDVVLDLRRGSPTYGRHATIRLSAQAGNMVYVPVGLAHGFCTRSDPATLHYVVSSVHAPEHDRGIRWDSAGIAWPVEQPLVSPRDLALPGLPGFDSPFVFVPGEDGWH